MSDHYDNPSYYTNRELSWLEFNHRCMMEALNSTLFPTVWADTAFFHC